MKIYLSISIIFSVLWIQACSTRTVETITVNQAPVTPTSPTGFDEMDQEVTESILRLGEVNKIRSFDPLFANNSASHRVIQLLYDGLVALDSDEQIVPSIASRWEVSRDSLEYTFYLNRNVFFHDDSSFSSGIGRRVIATDFKLAFERMASRDVPPDAAYLFLDHIFGFEPYFFEQREIYHSAERTLNEIAGIRAINDSTLIISLIEPDSDFLVKLASPYAVVYPNEALRHRQRGLRDYPVGSGPYLFGASHGDSLHILIKNPDYHHSTDSPERIEILNTSDESIIFRQFAIGQLNAIMELGPQMIRSLVNDDNELELSYREQYRLIALNHNEPYIVRFNPENRYGINNRHASVLAHMISFNSLQDNLGNPSLELSYRIEETENDAYLNDLRRRFPDRQENRRLILALQPEPFAHILGAQMVRFFNEELNAALMHRRLFSREIALFMEKHIRFTRNGNNYPQPQEILRFNSDRYVLMNHRLEGIEFNSFSWWFSVSNMQLSETPL